MHKETQKKVEAQINYFTHKLCGSYLNEDNGGGAIGPQNSSSNNYVPKDIEKILNRKIEKDDLREIFQQKDIKIDTLCQ